MVSQKTLMIFNSLLFVK